jgi:hypothetical protein
MTFLPFLRPQVAGRLATPVNFRENAALELDNFPEFVSDIAPEQQVAIDNLAVQIIKSNNTNDPIFGFRTEGHADIARTIPAGQRKQFEQDISNERAENAFKLLIDAINRKGGPEIARKISKNAKAFGLGSSRLKIPNAVNEPQFRKNRRVVLVLRQVTMQPPPAEPEPPPKSVIEDRFTARLTKSGNVTVGALKVIESFTLTATIEVVDKIDKKRASFNVLATGVGLGIGPTKIGGSIVFNPGQAVPFKTFRLFGTTAAKIDLNSFVGKVTVFVDGGGGAGPSATTKGGTLSFSFDALEDAGANTQPTIIRLSGGNDSLSAPSFSAGDVLPIGRMTMIGSPTDI